MASLEVLTLARPRVSRSDARWTATVAALVLVFITAAETVTTYVSPVTGIALHAILLSALIAFGSTSGEGTAFPSLSRFLYALTLVPLIRILSLSMPLTRFEETYWYAVVGGPVLVAVLVVMASLRLRPAAVGLRLGRLWPLQVPVVALGFGLGIVEYYILRPQPLIDTLTLEAFWAPALVLLLATGFLEELLFRGVLQGLALPALGTFLGVVYVSGVFALLHMGYQSVLDMAFVLAIALLYGWAVHRTGSIMGVSLSHGLTNITLFLVVPFMEDVARLGERLGGL